MTTTTSPPTKYIEFWYTVFVDGEMVKRHIKMTLKEYITASYPFTEYIVTTTHPLTQEDNDGKTK